MKQSLVKGLEEDKQKEMEADFKASVHLRKRLAELLDDAKEGKVNEALQDSAFDSPNWAHKQAYNMGFAAAIKHAISLLS